MGNETGSIIWAVVGLAAIGLLIGGYVWLQRRQRADLLATIHAIAVPASRIPGALMTDAEAHEFYADPANLAVTGPGQKRGAPRKTAMVSIRFDPAVIAAVKEAAGDGQTVGAWIRRAVQAELGRARLEPGGRKFHSRSLTVTGSPGPVFGCVHMTVANVTGASCAQCGPLAACA